MFLTRSKLLICGLLLAVGLSGCKALLKAGVEGGQAAAKTTTKVAAKGGDNVAKAGEAGVDAATKAGKNVTENADQVADAANKSDNLAGEVAERSADAVEALMTAQELFESESSEEWDESSLSSFRDKSGQARDTLKQQYQSLKPGLDQATAQKLDQQADQLDEEIAALGQPGADAESVAKVKATGLEFTKQLNLLSKKS